MKQNISIFGPLLLIATGAIWLLIKSRNIPASNLWALTRIWPFLLIAAGIGLILRPYWTYTSLVLDVIIIGSIILTILYAPNLGWDRPTFGFTMRGSELYLGHKETCSGKVITQTRNVSEVLAVKVDYPAEVVITQGATQSIDVKAEDNLIAGLKTEVHNGVLEIFYTSNDGMRVNPTLECIAFFERQKSLLEQCYCGEVPRDTNLGEKMLIELVQHDEKNSGLQIYLYNMMEVMGFDAKRRGKLISQVELNEYTRWLASAVTEAMHYFIGHNDFIPQHEAGYLAASAAHITHMLRDTFDDVRIGYYNIPRETLEDNHIKPQDIWSNAYCTWVKSRVKLAREYFKAGKAYFARVQNWRCRIAGFAYIARFEWLLDTIEREDYHSRPEYRERKSLGTKFRIALPTLWSMVHSRGKRPIQQTSTS